MKRDFVIATSKGVYQFVEESLEDYYQEESTGDRVTKLTPMYEALEAFAQSEGNPKEAIERLKAQGDSSEQMKEKLGHEEATKWFVLYKMAANILKREGSEWELRKDK